MLQGPGAGLAKEQAEFNINRARGALHSLLCTGICKGMNPLVGYKMYSRFVEPILLYTTEFWTSANSAIDLLEGSYMKTLRTLQNLPDRTASVGVMTLLEVQPIRAKIHQPRLSFLWNIIQSESLYSNGYGEEEVLNIPDQ